MVYAVKFLCSLLFASYLFTYIFIFYSYTLIGTKTLIIIQKSYYQIKSYKSYRIHVKGKEKVFIKGSGKIKGK